MKLDELILKKRVFLIIFSIIAMLWALIGPWPQNTNENKAINKICSNSHCYFDDVVSFQWVWPNRVKKGKFWQWHPGVFLASKNANAPSDVYVADFMVTSSGTILKMRRMINVSQTADGDEVVLSNAGDGRVAFAAHVNNIFSGVTIVDFNGENIELTKHWSKFWKIANKITNFQRTGRTQGIHWRTYVLHQTSKKLDLSFVSNSVSHKTKTPNNRNKKLQISIDTGNFLINEDGSTKSTEIIVQEMVKGHPAFLAWTVDTVRSISWVGRRKIEWLEKFWFDFNDWFTRTRYDLSGYDVASDVASDGYVEKAKINNNHAGIPGWPPPNIAPKLKKKKIATEGVWIAIDESEFTVDVPGPSLFYKTFFRPDKARPYSRVHLISWDTSRIELKMVAGVREPQSTTGLRGRGEIPRKDPSDQLSRFVGGFNGAFQSLHGEWGMVIDKKTFLPPRSYGATVAVFDDGRVGMGTWPYPVIDLPEQMNDLRQNIHPIVENGKFNPYKRTWWGGVPEGVEERVVTARSALCLTFEGKLIYFWGKYLAPETLGETMIVAGCDYGIHLDMNQGHCGFEYYRVSQKGQQPSINRKLDEEIETEGIVPRREDLFFRAKKMTRSMGNMRFPRYIGRDPRDFFYLLLKKSIFDHPLSEIKETGWIPLDAQKGYPVFAVIANLKNNANLIKIDINQAEFSVEDKKPDNAIIAIPFTTSAEGIVTGFIRNKTTISPMQSGAVGMSFGTNMKTPKMSFTKPGETGAGKFTVQGLSPVAAKIVHFDYLFGLNENGYLFISQIKNSMDNSVNLLNKVFANQKLALISPTGSKGEQVFWFIVRAKPRSSWIRMFKEVKPVSPPAWKKVFRERGKLLDHSEEKKNNNVTVPVQP